MLAFFDYVDIPNVNKLSLYRSDLVGTKLFEEYGKHGDLWYIVARSREYGHVVGVTRDVSVTIFNITEKNKYLEYMEKEIYPLILYFSFWIHTSYNPSNFCILFQIQHIS